MKEEEYKKRLHVLLSEFEENKKELMIECAMENNTVKIGDTVTDHIGSLLVERIRATTVACYGVPSCIYSGVELTKKGVPKIRQDGRAVYQANMER